MVRLIFSVIILFFVGCTTEKSRDFSGQEIQGLASVIRMNAPAVKIVAADYFRNTELIDSVTCSPGFSVSFNEGMIALSAADTAPHMGVVNCWLKGVSYDIVCFKSKKQAVQFSLKSTAKKVQIAGEMNNWSPQKFEQTAPGLWTLDLSMDPGKYQYQLVVDDVWQLDPGNESTADNGNGGTNSLLQVGEIYSEGPSQLFPSFNPEHTEILFNNQLKELNVFWENFHLEPFSNKNKYSYKIPQEAKKRDRSHLRGWSVNARGQVSDFLIPLQNGVPVVDPDSLRRQDKHSNVLYFMLVDRFCNGDTHNDEPLTDPEVHPKANYYGGDISGILQKVQTGFFTDLGISTIWLSPITQNPLHAETEYPAPHRKYSGYHGYWPISATEIDHRLGNEAELKELVKTAHSKNINVILDYVSNHVHEENPIIKAHPDWATALDLPDGRKNIRIWDEQRLTTWFDLFLPTLDFSKPEVIELMTDSALYMLQKYDLDGFRHDATKHIPEAFWRRLTQKIKQNCKRPVYQIGETFGSRELIGSYVSSGQMDGQFDFNLYFDLRSVLAGEKSSFRKLDESVHASIQQYGSNSLMGNITGNHDISRFISYAGKGLRFSEDDKKAGWTRDIQVEDTIGYEKLKLLTAFIMTSPGVPVIYYGDEIGMPGAGDPDNRRPMKFEGLSRYEQSVRDNAKRLIALRKSRMSLMYGDYQTKYLSDEVYAYSRNYLGESTLILLNKSGEKKDITIDNVQYNLLPYSFKTIITK